MTTIIELGKDLVGIGKLEKKFDVDSVDRLKYRYTNWILLGTSMFIFNKNYLGKAMNCWTPKQIRGSWDQYIETYCLIENTYFVPMNESNLPSVDQREAQKMIYYQWVPFFLLIMGAFLYLPRWLWTQSQKYLGLDLPAITFGLRKAARGADEGRDAAQLALRYKDKFGSRLALGLILTKLASIVVLITELVFLNWVLGPTYTMWGFGVLNDLLHGRHWEQSGHFPRVTFCDVQVREMGGVVHNWTLQCVLAVNMFNEKVFLVLWWWLIALVIVSILNICSWLYRTIHRHNNVQFVLALLEIDGIKASHTEVDYFVDDVLKRDGCVVLRLVADNATVFQAADYVRPLWQNYTEGLHSNRSIVE